MSPGVAGLIDAAYHQSKLPPRVREAARLRIAQLNECPISLQFRAASVMWQGVDEELYAHVAEYRKYPGYSEEERLAVEYAERFVTDHLGIDDGQLAIEAMTSLAKRSAAAIFCSMVERYSRRALISATIHGAQSVSVTPWSSNCR
jgi:alkylhydroperoxidase family enzyme